jgi:Fe-S oxidoreductase, related to NifB/MoaA family
MLKELHGIKVLSVARNGAAYKAGLRRGDIVLYVNGETIGDGLDFRFYSSRPDVNVLVRRKNKKISFPIRRANGVDLGSLGARFKDRPIRRCCNRCIFCFIDQMPAGLRKSLYIKDEDYRYSFTNGNYLTLSRATGRQLSHIIELGLSPLYVSVHATDASVRKRMLGNPLAIDIMDQLRFLEKNDVRFHTQVVVCPGINDGQVLAHTIRDLLTLKNGLLSIAVVPVGLTRHRKIPLQPVTRSHAEEICRDVGDMSDSDKKKTGKRRIFLADELFIKAQAPIPANGYYEEYPQIENGVGLIRQMLIEWKTLKKRITAQKSTKNKTSKSINKKKYLVLTSVSAFSYIQSIIHEMVEITGIPIDVIAVKNTFFGDSVTVAGLLTARDVIKSSKPIVGSYSAVFIPAVMFNMHGHTMDGYSKARIENQVGARIEVMANLQELIGKLF